MQLGQMDLVIAILREIERQCPGSVMPPRVFKSITDGANEIVAQFNIPFRAAVPACGLASWLRSDDTGRSSLFMAHILYGAPVAAPHHPHDDDDFGRCKRLLEACGEPDNDSLWTSLSLYDGWEPWVQKLRQLL